MHDESRLSKGRRRVISVGLLLATATLSYRLFELQVTHHEALAARARAQTESVLEIPGPRGDIVDRSGRLLACSVPVHVLAAEPRRIGMAGLAALERAAGVAPGRLTQRAKLAWLEVRRDCDDDCRRAVTNLVQSKLVPIDALHWEAGFARRYPHATRAAHLLGFVNLEGTLHEGLEHVYDEGLRSRHGRLLRLTDARQEAFDHVDGDGTPPPAQTLQLTLDLRIQTVLEEALVEAVREHGARSGRGVVLDTQNGDILALAAVPTFDPNTYGKSTQQDRRNPVTALAAEPGSVMKPFTAAALLEHGAYRVGETVFCELGAWKRGPRVIHDTHPHGTLTLPEVIEVSSNIGIVKFAQRLTPASLHATLGALGFGRKTGVDLPAESRGQLAPVERWTSVDRDNIAFGHALSATLLQIANALATLANGGKRLTPHVGQAWIMVDGTIQPIAHAAPETALSTATSWQLRQFMRSVVESEHGTGKRAAVEGYFVGGKTGTAEMIVNGRYDKLANLSSFAGFAPVDRPVAVVAITLEAPRLGGRTGGMTAAPAFSRVMSEVLRLRRIAPDNLPEPEPDRDGSTVVAQANRRDRG